MLFSLESYFTHNRKGNKRMKHRQHNSEDVGFLKQFLLHRFKAWIKQSFEFLDHSLGSGKRETPRRLSCCLCFSEGK